jgi:hypothetical protein
MVLGRDVKEIIPAPVATPALKDFGDLRLCRVPKTAYTQWVAAAGGTKKAESPGTATHDHVGDHEEPHQKRGDQAQPVRICRRPDITIVEEDDGCEKRQHHSHHNGRRRARLVELPTSLGVFNAGERLRARR